MENTRHEKEIGILHFDSTDMIDACQDVLQIYISKKWNWIEFSISDNSLNETYILNF